MNLVVTGGCGFIGLNLAMGLSEQGHKVFVMDNLSRKGSETNLPKLREAGIDFIHGDIRNPEDFSALPRKTDALIESSAQPSVVSGYHNPVYDFRTNVEGVINCLEFCRKTGAGMIFLSSSRVYPASKINDLPNREFETRFDWWEDLSSTDQINGFDPEYGIAANFSVDGATKTIYGASKAAADCFCQEYADAFGLPVIINRCGVVAGAGQFGLVTQGWFTFWAISCLFERPLRYFGHKGKQVRDILFIDDLFDLIRIQLNRIDSLGGKVWNVGGGRANSISLMEAGALMEEIFGRPVKASVEEEVRRGDMLVYITDNRRAYEDLNWAPRISLEQGAQRIARWVTDNRSMLANSGL